MQVNRRARALLTDSNTHDAMLPCTLSFPFTVQTREDIKSVNTYEHSLVLDQVLASKEEKNINTETHG